MTEQTVQLVPTGAPELVPAEAPAADVAAPDTPKKDKDKKKKKERSRGIETMFRVTYANHISLSRLADSKISMLIAANGGIISVVITLVAKTATVSWHFAPVLVLLAGCLVSLVFTVTAARPRLHRSHVDVGASHATECRLRFDEPRLRERRTQHGASKHAAGQCE